MEAPNITMDSPSELEKTNSSLVSTEIPETGVLESESQVSDKPKTQPPLLTKPFVINTSTPKIELDGAEWLDVKTPNPKKPPVVAFDVDKTAKKLATDFKTFQAEKKAFEQELNQFNKIAPTSVATPELIQKQKELSERGAILNTTANELEKTSRRVEIDRFELKKTAVRNFAKKAEQGNVFGATWNSIVNGYKTTGLGNARLAIDLGIELLDRVGLPWASKEDMKSMTKDEAKKKVIADMTPIITKGYDVAKTKGTTEEFIEKRKKSGVIPRAWYGAMESANIMATGGNVPVFVTGSVMGYQAINDQIDKSNDPALRNMDENTRKLITLPIAVVNGAIEVVNYITLGGGAKKLVTENLPGLAKFTSYVLSKLPKNATVKMITEAAKQLAATPAGKVILMASGDLGTAYAVEGTTGGLQAINDQAVKEIYDATHDMDLFKNPAFFSKQFLGKVAEDFNTEGVGGVMLRSIGMGASALSTATGSKDLSDEAYQVWSTLAQDKDQRDLYLAKIKADLASKRITVEEAQNRMTTLKNTVGIASQIPTDLPIASQKQAFGILNNNRLIENRIKELEDYMAGKNPNLVTSVQSEIDGLRDQINKNNTELSKLPKNAVQEQTTSEVPVQPTSGGRVQMAEGESQTEPQVSTQEGKSTEEINKEREAYGLEPLKPTYRGTSLDEWENVKNGGKFKSEQGFGENESDVTWVSDNKQYSDEYVNSNDNGVLIEFKPEAIDKSSSESGQKNDNTGVRLGRGLDFNDVQKVTDANGNVLYEAESKTPTQEGQVEEVKVEAPKAEEVVTPTETIEVFHGGDLPSLEKGKPLYVSEDKSQANEYAKMSDGKVSKFFLDKNKIASEEDAYSIMEELGLPTDGNFFELIDPRFDEALPEEDIKKVFDTLKERGFDAVRYTDIDQKDLKSGIQNILVLDASKSLKAEPVVEEQAKPSEETQVNAVQKGIDAVNKALQRGRSKKEAVQGGIAFMQKTIAYEQADDVTREQMLRDINKEFGVKEKKAPSTKKILGEKPQTKTVNTMTVLKERIAEIDQAIKEGQRNFKTAVKDIATAIKAILPKGKFSTSQVKVIVNGMASNLLNPKLREQAMERIRRVVANVEEATKLANMYNIRASLKDARKRTLDVNIINMVNNFIDIDPKFIDNFDEYLDYANRVYEASKAIKFVKDEDGNKVLDPRSIENFAEIDEYSKKQLENQEEILKDNLLSQYQSLVDSGALSEDMSLQQIKDYVKSLEEDEKNQDDDKDKILMDYAKESFDESKEVLQTYLDDDAIDTEDRELIQGFIDIDINDLAPMQAYEAAEALMNYRVNGSTSRMGKVLANYIGAAGVKDLASQINIEGRVNVGGTRRLRYKAYGKAFDIATRFFTLGKAKPNLVETLPNAYSDFWFKYNSALDNLGTTYFGPENWRAIRIASGLNKVVDGNNKKKKIIDDFTKEISDKYKDKKIGDNNVFTQYAMNEIGVIANLYRQTDNPKKANAYFNDRRTILEEYIDYLKSSKKPEEIAAGEMMQDIYDKLNIANAKNGQEIFDNADPVAKDIINDFINKFAGYYPDFARITQQQYNIILGNDRNYTADTWVNVSRDTGNESDKIFNKGFFKSNNIVETEESGRFKEVKFPSHLKKVKGKVVNIPSYDFMQNNINALSETVGDIYTIEGRNQFAGFIDSPYLDQLIQDEDSRQLFTDRATFDINLLTGNETIPRRSAFERKVAKGITYIGRAATKAGLSSIESVATQSAPVLLATSFNLSNPAYLAKASKDFLFDSNARDFINNSKYGIANRGPVSQTSIDYVDNLLANGDYSNADKLLKTLGKATEFLVNTELVGTDVVTAKTSWLAYYMDDLAKQGESPMNIDWATHKVNDKAARYAESMVEKEQNLNTAELSGKLWASKDPRLKIVRSLMPFAGFSVKQKDKVKANMSTLFKESNLATKEEKIMAAKSLVGTMAEQALFNYIKAAVLGTGVGIAYSLVNKKETKEEEELRNKRSRFKQIADLFETFNGSMDFFEKEVSAQVNNKILDIIENSWDKFAKGKDIDILDLLKTPKEEKKRNRPFVENVIPKTQSRIKRLKLEKELKKKFRFYESADADIVEQVFNLFGGSIKVLGTAQWNALQGILDASKGYFANSDGDKVEYTKKQKEELRLNIPFYITQIFAPGLIPTNVSRLFKDERKIIQESANMDYQRRKAGRERAKRELNN